MKGLEMHRVNESMKEIFQLTRDGNLGLLLALSNYLTTCWHFLQQLKQREAPTQRILNTSDTLSSSLNSDRPPHKDMIVLLRRITDYAGKTARRLV